jgi:ribosomal protein S18 acetylase RimI-like enzyme
MFREARPTDCQAIAALHAASWRFAYRGALTDAYLAGDLLEDRARLWARRLDAPAANQVVLVTDAPQPTGFACLYVNEDPGWGSLLDNLHVAEPSLRRGVGSMLLNEVAAQAARRAPGNGLYLWVLQSNLRAQSFYEAWGGEKVGSDVWHAPDGTLLPRHRYAWRADAMPVLGGHRRSGQA